MAQEPKEKTAAKDNPSTERNRADNELRNHFAGIALAEIVKWQVANKQGGKEDLAASWAYRYADRMISESRVIHHGMTANVRGSATVPQPAEPSPSGGLFDPPPEPAPIDPEAQPA